METKALEKPCHRDERCEFDSCTHRFYMDQIEGLVRNRKAKNVTCVVCGKVFLKEVYEILKSERLGTSHCCSLKCVSRRSALVKHGESVGFGFYSNMARKRARKVNLDYDLDPLYLKELFESQNGECAVTQIPLVLNRSGFNKKDKRMDYASLDRIDSSKGYIKGNVQFVCLGINYMKNTFSSQEVLDFLKKIHQPSHEQE